MKKLFFFVLIAFAASDLLAQMIDDSTKLVYGPTSSRYITIEDLKHSDTLYHFMDTSLYNLENFEISRSSDVRYQDLGNNGTALNPVYYPTNRSVGRTTGFNAYSPFVKSTNDFKYYDTKSPYANLTVAFGGFQRNTTNFEFSRNVNERWNFGFDIYRINSIKQVAPSRYRDPQVNHSSFDFYVFYRSKDTKYHVMAHAYTFSHTVEESGGILTTTDELDYFKKREWSINLRDARSWDDRKRYFLYQEYSLKPYFELFNTVNIQVQENGFSDYSLSNEGGYFNYVLFNASESNDKSLLKTTEIKAGIKGRIVDRIFYSGYLENRSLNFKYKYLDPFDNETEIYLGGDLKWHINKKNTIGGEVEIMDQGYYFFKGFLKNNFIELGYTSSHAKPSYLVESFFSNHHQWNNNFSGTFTNTIKGKIHHDFSFVNLAAEVDLTTVNGYLYFDQQQSPNQVNNALLINKYKINADLSPSKKFHFENELIFNTLTGNGSGNMRIPDWNYNGKWYYDGIWFNNYMQLQMGFDLHWQSSFFANGYAPSIQQFHLQDDLAIDNFWTVDFFFVMKAKNFSLFTKILYINQQRNNGYFATPYYPGMFKTFDIGARWMFFD